METFRSKFPILIANRGEIAIRITRTCRALGYPTVAVYSDADRFAEHVQACDQAVWIGGAAPQESYLNIERVIEAARRSGAKAIHPGYGFLSERAAFVTACEGAGIVFIGPSAESMRLMGDKITARNTVAAVGVVGVPGSAGAVESAKAAEKIAAEIGYPILLKATAGGGGKGMRRVDAAPEMSAAFDGASREALGAFGDGAMYVEKYILEPHHVEIQVFGDGKGGAIHLGERECSIQRRHQKVWEESPSPILEAFPKTREAMFAAAVRAAGHVKYAGAGTFEFIVDGQGKFYFLEMNTRLQVEHPVTEWVTGVDLVDWQIRLACEKMTLPAIPARSGSAIEVRLYAEDPRSFLPAPGPLGLIQLPTGAFTRSDAAFSRAGEVSVHYDPMIAKISVWAPTRSEAVGRLRAALDETRVEPPKGANGTRIGSLRTNLSFLQKLARNPAAIRGETTTDLIANHADLTDGNESELTLEAALAIALDEILSQNPGREATASPSAWSLAAQRESLRP